MKYRVRLRHAKGHPCRRCVAGSGSADHQQFVSRDRCGIGNYSGHQQDRSSRRDDRYSEASDHGPHRVQGRRDNLASAKMKVGVDEILEAIITRIPAPSGDPNAPLKALIFDSIFDGYRGSVCYVRVVDGTIKQKQQIKFFVGDKIFDAEEVGHLAMQREATESLSAGDVGYIIPVRETFTIRKSVIRSRQWRMALRSRFPVTKRRSRWCSRSLSGQCR